MSFNRIVVAMYICVKKKEVKILEMYRALVIILLFYDFLKNFKLDPRRFGEVR